MKDGDIFHWTFKGENVQHGPFGSYHCCSQIAVFENGVLRDTYWSAGGSCRTVDPAKVNLTYRGNKRKMTEIRESVIQFYRPEDVVDMRHSNNSRAPIYIKPGAERDAETMRENIRWKIERCKSEINSANRRIEMLHEDLAKIEAGDLNKVYG